MIRHGTEAAIWGNSNYYGFHYIKDNTFHDTPLMYQSSVNAFDMVIQNNTATSVSATGIRMRGVLTYSNDFSSWMGDTLYAVIDNNTIEFDPDASDVDYGLNVNQRNMSSTQPNYVRKVTISNNTSTSLDVQNFILNYCGT